MGVFPLPCALVAEDSEMKFSRPMAVMEEMDGHAPNKKGSVNI